MTFIPSAPASIIAMLNEPELPRRDLRSLRVVITGGASCPRRDDPRVSREDARAPDRAVRDAGDGLPHVHASHGRSGGGERYGRPRRIGHGAAASSTTRPRRPARRRGRDRRAGSRRAPRLPQEPGGERRAVHRGRLVSHRRPGPDRRRRQRADRRPAQGDDQPRRQEVLPARDRGDPLHASEDPARRDRRPAGSSSRRAQLPLRDPAAGADDLARRGRRVPARRGRHLQAAGDARALRRVSPFTPTGKIQRHVLTRRMAERRSREARIGGQA